MLETSNLDIEVTHLERDEDLCQQSAIAKEILPAEASRREVPLVNRRSRRLQGKLMPS